MGNDIVKFNCSVYNKDIKGLNHVFEKKSDVGKVHMFTGRKITCCITSDDFLYFHYNMYAEVDFDWLGGWGCAYRCLQMMVSFYRENIDERIVVPKIVDIQNSLFEKKYFNNSHIGSREWIEPHHASVYIRRVLGYQTEEIIYYKFKSCSQKKREEMIERSERKRVKEENFKIVLSKKSNAVDLGAILFKHFKEWKSPVMVDNSMKAYIIGGIRKTLNLREKKEFFEVLIFDPHVHKGYSVEVYEKVKDDTRSGKLGVYWIDLEKFFLKSKYKRWMICCPTRRSNIKN